MCGGLDVGIVDADQAGIAGVQHADFDLDAGRRDGLNEALELGEGGCGLHAGNKAHGDFGHGLGGDDGFGAGADEAAGHAVHVERGARPGALQHAVAGLANQCGGADFGLAVVLLVEGQRAPGGQFLGAGRNDAVVDAGDEDVAVVVLHFGNHLRQSDEGIGRRAAVHAGVQIGFCAAHFHFGVDHAAQADAERGQAGRKELGVADQREVGCQVGGLGGDVGSDAFAANFFLAFKQHADVDGQLAGCGQQRLERLNLRPDLAFVIDRAAGVEIAVALGWLKGRRVPLVQRLGRLHIVVAVNEHRRLARRIEPVGIDERVAGGFLQGHVLHADALELRGDKVGGAAAVGGMLGQRGDRRNAEQVLELGEKTRVVLRGKVQCGRRHTMLSLRQMPKGKYRTPGRRRACCGCAESGTDAVAGIAREGQRNFRNAI